MMRHRLTPLYACTALAIMAAPAAAQTAGKPASAPQVILPAPVATATPAAPPATTTPPASPASDPSAPPAPPAVLAEPVLPWTPAQVGQLITLIEGIGSEGLIPADYRPDALRAALAAGPGTALDEAATRSFAWLVEDLRDGRTPVPARVQWFALDPDREAMPTLQVMTDALASGDIAGIVRKLAPTHPDYAALRDMLASTPDGDSRARSLILANMDRWRWLQRDLGSIYLLTNVPEFQLRLAVNHRNIRTYRTVVGKPGRTATPQLAERVQAVVFNPTWTVPQSIVVGEGLGARLSGSPGAAAREGYKVTRAANGTLTVVQQPGPSNALGLMKIDMPNPHAIYLHDTPSKSYFNHTVRAYSHGCVRTERAVELGMTMAILGAQMTPEAAAQASRDGKYKRVAMSRTFPIYITYFTMARDINGTMGKFGDIYGRDAPVIASFAQPRELKTTQRISSEAIIKLDNPL